MVMCWIPPGEFLMGSPDDEENRNDDETQHRVKITQGFWLAKTRTTPVQWEAVMGSYPRDSTGENMPFDWVRWDNICENEAGTRGFLGKLNMLVPEGGRFHLPTEAQWEYACRAGTTGPYAGNLDKKGCMDAIGAANRAAARKTHQLHEVDHMKSNAWGLHDMHDYTWEWCSDWYGDYDLSAVTDPAGPAVGTSRVRRGGGWHDLPYYCRVALRGAGFVPAGEEGDFGFRLARSSAISVISRSHTHIQTSKTLAARHRIGEHELYGPDYRLVCACADDLRLPPEEVLRRLQLTGGIRWKRWDTRIEDGRFKALHFDRETLPISSIPSVAGLIVETLFLRLQEAPARLDLSMFPDLIALKCAENQLIELDLSEVPNLTVLSCAENQLTELDIRNLRNLETLRYDAGTRLIQRPDQNF
jgi:formylglycine-generating enzyme required for sulfatase activity